MKHSSSLLHDCFLFGFRRNVLGQFALLMDWNRVNAFQDPVNRKRNRANFVAKFPVKIIHARARSIGTRRLMMFPTCLLSQARLVMTILDIATCSRSVGKLIRQALWRLSENFSCPKKALLLSRNGSSAIGMQSV